MYEDKFGLNRRPFRSNATGADVFVGPQTARIMQSMKKTLASTDAVVTVCGKAGVGKTTLATRALDNVDGNNLVIRIARMQLRHDEVLDFLLAELGASQLPASTIQRIQLFKQLLGERRDADTRVLIIVEDAVRLGQDALSELEALTEADAGRNDGANVILLGDTSLTELLDSPVLERLNQRTRLRLTVLPLNAGELLAYLKHGMRLAGGEFDLIFAEGSAQMLFELSEGVPRVTNYLVESILTAASDQNLSRVDTALVARVASEEYGLSVEIPAIETAVAEPVSATEAEAEAEAIVTPDPEFNPSPQLTPEPELAAATGVAEEPNANVQAVPVADVPHFIQDTLPDLEVLAPDLAAKALAENAEPESIVSQELTPEPDSVVDVDALAEPRMFDQTIPKLTIAADLLPPMGRSTEPESPPVTETAVEPVLDAEPEPEIEPLPMLAAESAPSVETAPVLAAEPTAEIEPLPVLAAEPTAEIEPLPVLAAEPTAEIEPLPVLTAEPEPKVEPVPVLAAEPVPEIEPLPVLAAEAALEVDPLPILEMAPEPVLDAHLEISPSTELETEPTPTLTAEPVLAVDSKPTISAEPVAAVDAAPVTAPESEHEMDAELLAVMAASSDSAVAESDRDPTLAELRPDMDALEEAMAGFTKPETVAEEKPDATPEPVLELKDPTLPSVPEITLDSAIQDKIESAGNSSEANSDAPKPDPELQKIAADLAKAKSIEDVDDKMAETLFGAEISMIAAQVIANPPSADATMNELSLVEDTGEVSVAEADEEHSDGLELPQPATAELPTESDLENEFKKVYGENALEVSLQGDGPSGGLDLNASQRLATVRALNTGQVPASKPASNGAANGSNGAAASNSPKSIEDQITTSMTQTLRTLSARPDSANEEDEDDETVEEKRGFFSRFRRS